MSKSQNRQHLPRSCRSCGGPATHRGVCAACDPAKGTRKHRDRYADRVPAPTDDDVAEETGERPATQQEEE